MSAYTDKFTKDLAAFYEWVEEESELELKEDSVEKFPDLDDINWTSVRENISFDEPGRNKLDNYIKCVMEDFVISFSGEDCEDSKVISKMYKEYVEKKKQEKKEKKNKPVKPTPTPKIPKSTKTLTPKKSVETIPEKDDPMDIDTVLIDHDDLIYISMAIYALKKCKTNKLKSIIHSLNTINTSYDSDDDKPVKTSKKPVKKSEPVKTTKSEKIIESDDDEPVKTSKKSVKKSKKSEQIIESDDEDDEPVKTFKKSVKKSESDNEDVPKKSPEQIMTDLFDELNVNKTEINLDDLGDETEEVENDEDDIDEDELLENMD